jgi:hypothetical protein
MQAFKKCEPLFFRAQYINKHRNKNNSILIEKYQLGTNSIN